MSFRSVPKSVTLNDLERRNGSYSYYVLFHRIRYPDSGAHCVKLVEDIPKLSAQKYSPKLLVFSDILLMAIFAVDHPSDGFKVRNYPVVR